MNKALIIVGMHRSGTSLTASILQECGLDIGKELMPDTKGNVKGHFENMEFYRFHMDLLRRHDEHPDGWVDRKIRVRNRFYAKGKKLIASNQSAQWGWKDPRTTLFLNYWSRLLPDAKYLFVYRKPWEVVDSMIRRDTDSVLKEDIEVPVKSWTHYNKLALEHYDKHQKDSLLVDIDTVIHNSSQFIAMLNSRLGFNLTEKESEVFDESIFIKEASEEDAKVLAFKKEYPETVTVLNALMERAWFPGKDIDVINYPLVPVIEEPAPLSFIQELLAYFK
jgi:hypothetical protein